jgi:hypothetical protein
MRARERGVGPSTEEKRLLITNKLRLHRAMRGSGEHRRRAFVEPWSVPDCIGERSLDGREARRRRNFRTLSESSVATPIRD